MFNFIVPRFIDTAFRFMLSYSGERLVALD